MAYARTSIEKNMGYVEMLRLNYHSTEIVPVFYLTIHIYSTYKLYKVPGLKFDSHLELRHHTLCINSIGKGFFTKTQFVVSLLNTDAKDFFLVSESHGGYWKP